MKIFVLNSSGNAGKSLITRELFYPRMENAKIIEIETVNSGGNAFSCLNIQKYKGDEDFTSVYMDVMENENLILDVGASNLTVFWENMKQFAGVEETFDYFVIPTSSSQKIQEDTFKTIEFLRSEGIPDEKIKVIFNKVSTTVQQDFEVLLSVDFPFSEELYLKNNEALFNDLGFLKKTIFEIFNPDINGYKAQIMSAKTGEERLKLVKMDLSNRQAQKIKVRMDAIFEEITENKALWIENDNKPTKTKKATPKPKTTPKKEEAPIKENEVNESGVNEDDEEI